VSAEPLSPVPDAAAGPGAAMLRLIEAVERVVRGRRAAVEIVVAATVAGGHVLIEDVPGSGKTTLARAVARAVGGDFRRIQGTADLLPSDITGSAIWEPEHRAFTFVPGPVFAHVVLVDELNRVPPRTQSALLEAMDEAAVTVDGVRYALPDPFVLLATQNPVEQHGTYPLPEGQLDRFTALVGLGPNDVDTERLVVREQLRGPTIDALEPVMSPDELVRLRAHARTVHVADSLIDYGVAVAAYTRRHERVALGASTRAAIALVRCAQATALLHGRDHVLPDDIKDLASAVLAHRLVMGGGSYAGTGQGLALARTIVAEAVQVTPVPLVR
jgi:MoxR-like ATPase